MNFKLLDIICILGGIQGIFLAFSLQTITDKNKSANRILSLILFTAAFFLLFRITFFEFTDPLFVKITFSANTVMFIFSPLVYTYIRRLTFEESKKFRLPSYHYIPAISYFFLVIYVFFILRKDFNEVIYKLLTIQILAITLNLYYLFKSH